MWEIVICDADEVFVQTLEEKLTEFYRECGLEIHVRTYAEGYSFLEDVDEPMDLIFLSTRLPKLDGYLLAEVIRSRPSKKDSMIVFLGEQDGDVFGTFPYRPFDYIRKNCWEDTLPPMLKRLWQYDHRERSIRIRYQRKERLVRVSDIRYIESQGHDLTVHCMHGEAYRFRGRLSELEEVLEGYYFVRTAKSFLVNCAHVQEMTNRIALRDGSELPCSKSCNGQAKQMWQRYMREMQRAW